MHAGALRGIKTILPWWLAITAAALLLRFGLYRETATLLESLFHLALLWFLLQQTSLLALLAELARPQRWFLIGLLCLLLGGQLAGRNALTFPFVHWSMYTTSCTGNRYLDYTAVRADGEEIRFPLASIFPSAARVSVWKLEELVQAVKDAKQKPQRQAAHARLDATLRAYGRRYNQAHPDALVHTINIWECTIPFDDYQDSSSISRHPIGRVQLP